MRTSANNLSVGGILSVTGIRKRVYHSFPTLRQEGTDRSDTVFSLQAAIRQIPSRQNKLFLRRFFIILRFRLIWVSFRSGFWSCRAFTFLTLRAFLVLWPFLSSLRTSILIIPSLVLSSVPVVIISWSVFPISSVSVFRRLWTTLVFPLRLLRTISPFYLLLRSVVGSSFFFFLFRLALLPSLLLLRLRSKRVTLSCSNKSIGFFGSAFLSSSSRLSGFIPFLFMPITSKARFPLIVTKLAGKFLSVE